MERPARDGPLEVLHEQLRVDLLAAEEALHQRLVLGLLDDALDERAALVLVTVQGPGVAGEQADQGAVRLAEVHRQHRVAERLPGLPHHPVVVGAGMVELGDDHDARHPDVGTLAPQGPGRLVDALVGGDHEHRAVRRPQPRPQLADEVGVARGVEQVDLHPLVHQGRERQAHRPLLPHLRLVEVADGAALRRAARPVKHTGRDQKGLDQGRLARSGGADEGHVADRVRPVRNRGGLLPAGARSLLSCHVPPPRRRTC